MIPGSDLHKQFSKRVLFLHLIILCTAGIIIKQLMYLQIEKGNHFKELAKKNRIRSVLIPAPRGKILDRNGKILVDNRPRFDLIATIEDVTSPENEARILSRFLPISFDKALKRIKDRVSHLPYEPSVIYNDLPMEDVVKFSENSYYLPGVDLEIRPVRSYRYNNLGCHILGYTGRISEKQFEKLKDEGYNQNDEIGKFGIESSYESLLRGEAGGRQIQIDSFGHLDKVFGEKKPIPGNDIYLTIDLDIQKRIEQAFSGTNGAACVMEVKTGNILGMLSNPGFNPNDFSTGDSSKISKYFIDEGFPLLNRCISSMYAPGSTYKPIVALAGMHEKVINEKTSIFCNGTFKLGNATWKCWRKWGHGETDITKSLEQSCNLFYYNIGKEIGFEPIYKMSSLFGFGKKTGIDLFGEKPGLLPSAKWKKSRFKNSGDQKWHLGDSINLSIGQGYLLATPLQLTCMTAAIASKGILPKPNLFLKAFNSNGKLIKDTPTPVLKDLNIDQHDLDLVRNGMKQVVHARFGTGRKSKIKGITSAGKTGTSQVKTRNGEIKNAWFICFAPYDDPQIALSIIIEDSESGGHNAAPVAREILAEYFNVHIEEKKEDKSEPVLTTHRTEDDVNQVLIEEAEKKNKKKDTPPQIEAAVNESLHSPAQTPSNGAN